MAIRRCRNSVRGSKLWGNQLEPHISQIHKIGDWQKDILPSLSILEIPFKVICKAAIHIYTGSTLVRYFDTSIFCYQCQSVRTSIFVAGYLRFTMYMYTVYIILHNNIQIHVPVFLMARISVWFLVQKYQCTNIYQVHSASTGLHSFYLGPIA